MQQKFTKKIQIKFREADPAGILFFGNILSLAHDTFEEFIQNAGFTWNEWFKTDEFIVPIRQTEAQFLSPFMPGQFYQIEVFVEKIGDSSLKMKYTFLQDYKVHAEVSMVHTFLNFQTKSKIRVPEKVRVKLEKFVQKA